jgi:hypothetical protein
MGKFKEMDLLRQEQEREAPVQEPVGDWVWSWLMDWCKRNGIAPATQDSLFEMVKDARSKFKSAPPAAQLAVPLTDEQAKKLLKDSDLLEMFENIGWYSAPLKGFNQNGLALIRAIEAAHGITEGGERG